VDGNAPLAAPAVHVGAWHGGSMHAAGPYTLSTKYMHSLFRAYPLQTQVWLGERVVYLRVHVRMGVNCHGFLMSGSSNDVMTLE
jgi:hypothetical protein